jgi:hypothetical protein
VVLRLAKNGIKPITRSKKKPRKGENRLHRATLAGSGSTHHEPITSLKDITRAIRFCQLGFSWFATFSRSSCRACFCLLTIHAENVGTFAIRSLA